MSVCGQQPEHPGFDRTGCGPCVCGAIVLAETSETEETA